MTRAFRVDWKPRLRTEEDVVGEICDYLTLRHIPWIRTHNSRQHPLRRGTLDLFLCLPWSGRTCIVEVKTGDGVVSEEQEDVMREWHAARALVFVARSVQEVAEKIDAEKGR